MKINENVQVESHGENTVVYSMHAFAVKSGADAGIFLLGL